MRSSGCVLEEIRGCGPVGVFWRKSKGAVQRVCSGGNQRVRSSECVLEGINQCGLAGVNMHCLNRISGCGAVGVV